MQHPRKRGRGMSTSRRRALMERAARAGRPVRITYHGETSCPGIEGVERVIEIFDLRESRAGDLSFRAWCRTCQARETFRIDRISSHRTLRGSYQNRNLPVSPYFTEQGHVPQRQRVRPFTPQHTNTPSLLGNMRERIAEADRFAEVFGAPEAYPAWSRPVPNRGRTRTTATPTPAWKCPRTTDDLLREVREQIHTADTFRAITAGVELLAPEAVMA